MFRIISSLMIAFSLTVSLAQASDVVVRGKVFAKSCSYYSGLIGDFQVNYANPGLPWGVTIELDYGYGGLVSGQWRDWQILNGYAPSRVGMASVGPYRWEARFHDSVADRGGVNYQKLQFVFKITLPDGRVVYDKGNYSISGYYEADFNYASGNCEDEPPVELMQLPLKSIEK